MRCPYCAEMVKDEAIVCRYCHSDLTAVRLGALAASVKDRLGARADRLAEVEARVARIEAAVALERPGPELPPHARRSFWWRTGGLFVLGSVVSLVGWYLLLVTGRTAVTLIPFLALLGVGAWAVVSDPQHAVKRYALLGSGLGAMHLIGVSAMISTLVYRQSLGLAVLWRTG